jgi:DNA (cytosine-5)-methyltransferase 1
LSAKGDNGVNGIIDVDNTEQFNCISLCTGYAGIELGLERVIPNLRTVCYVEVEAFACANLVAKIEQGKLAEAPIWTDIKTFNGRPFRNRVHIITGGYPCQPFSVAGQRKGESDPRHLWPHIERIIKAVRPVWCFFENVSGHLTIGFPDVYRSLRNLGYSVEAGLFTAAEVGAPHKRERLFILARRMDDSKCTGLPEIPKAIQRERQSISENRERFRDVFDTTSAGELADNNKQRLEGGKTAGNAESQRQESNKQPARYDRWPSRPGQPQYEWEEPRVVEYAQSKRAKTEKQQGQRASIEQASLVVNTRKQKSKGLPQPEEWNGDRETGDTGRQGQAKPRLGGAVNGPNSRVDRLRLLGNGVVPQCAELAFRTLIEKVTS